MKAIPAVKAVMTPFPYSIDADASIDSARRLMHEHGIRHLPVTEGGAIVGVVSERDLAVFTAVRAGRRGARAPAVRQVYTADPYVVDLSEPLDNVLAVMAERHIGSAIVTRKGRLAGVFTATDACRVLGRYLRERFRPGGGDEAA